MGINFLLPIIAGIVMTIMVGAQVAPSIVDNIKAKKVQYSTINNQDLIYEATKRYITLVQIKPNSINDLITNGFLDSTKNNNGFGGTYTISVDDTKGILTITTTIADTGAQQMFLKSFNNKNIPTQVSGTNNFETKYVLPTDIMHGSGLFMSGIPTQSIAPDKSKYKYWYDTSGDKVVLKMSDGTNWKEVKLVGGGGVSVGSIETFAGVAAKIPEGYLLCNGQEVSRTTYKDLFDVIGTTYGAGNGSTTFKVPDLRGEFIRGFDAGRGVDSGRVFGSSQADEFKSHTHNLKSEFKIYANKTDTYTISGNWYGFHSFNGTLSILENTGGVETRPRNIAMNYIIKY